MWIFTKHGFFSAVCARQADGKHHQPVDPDRIMVRARVRNHLEALKKRFPDLLGECEIQESVGTDYAFRLTVLTANWLIGVSSLIVLTLLALRTPKEEEMLIERFGQQYRDYMARTGRFIPRMSRQ